MVCGEEKKSEKDKSKKVLAPKSRSFCGDLGWKEGTHHPECLWPQPHRCHEKRSLHRSGMDWIDHTARQLQQRWVAPKHHGKNLHHQRQPHSATLELPTPCAEYLHCLASFQDAGQARGVSSRTVGKRRGTHRRVCSVCPEGSMTGNENIQR
jgi:hypothetical protein